MLSAVSSKFMYTDVEYFDGVTPVARRGRLQLTPRDLLLITDEGERFQFAFDRIVEITVTGGRAMLEIDDASRNSSSASLVFSDPEFLARLRAQLRGSEASLAVRSLGITARQKFLWALALLPLAIGVYYLFMYESYRLVPLEVDRQLGRTVEARLDEEFAACNDPTLTDFMDRLEERLAGTESRFDYRVSVVDHEAVNAFALPGGRILLFHGLIAFAETPEEVAAVLAHELAHVNERHGLRQLIRTLGISFISATVIGAGFEGAELAELIGEVATVGLVLKYSREFEEEADLVGADLLERAGISPVGFLTFFDRLAGAERQGLPDLRDIWRSGEEPSEKTDDSTGDSRGEDAASRDEDAASPSLSWLSTHPAHEERVAYFRRRAARVEQSEPPLLRPGQDWTRLKARCR